MTYIKAKINDTFRIASVDYSMIEMKQLII